MRIGKGVNLFDYVKAHNLKNVVAAKVDGKIVDLNFTLDKESDVEFIDIDSKEGLEILRHSAAHIMAQAIQTLFKNAKFAIGPAIENGFYYDVDIGRPLTQDDLKAIEVQMKKITAANYPFVRTNVSKKEALKLFKEKGDEYKVEIIESIPDEQVSLYQQGDFVDFCRGPHIPSTGYLKHFKLLSVASAYFRGDETRPSMQRIYGTAFATKEDLDNYLNFLEEVKKRDHRKLGKELDLFSINDDVGAGFVIWHPKGAMLREIIETFEKKEHLKRGYEFVRGPELLKTQLWKVSGHYDNYRENMYFTEIENVSFGIKPMNCLGHIQVYKSRLRSYRELPKRFFELGVVHRHEKSGVLHGLLRVREFTQDDAHIFCTKEQLNDEIIGVLDFVKYAMDIFKFDYEMEISTRPEKSIGTDEDWENATNALINALENTKRPYQINEGDGAFYGPKIDVKLKDAIGRKWQCATIQCDFTLPERFNLEYIDKDGLPKRPVMVHRVILGSIERFIAVLIENYAGDFPLWLAPIQARVIPVSEKFDNYANDVYEQLKKAEIRVDIEKRNETISKKIRYAELEKIPYILVVGQKESEKNGVSVRKRKEGDLGLLSIDEFITKIKNESGGVL
ncbi:MAG: threonine--tRNA ligase [Desulfurella sp.]|uniref:threonine--tRNA ligase n=1 Tax=Desulfurella sp. TaxID=1962857 RepID=UPI000CC2243B|nr:threonine--tRNA ligase [Desulfurella sp.]PMP87445.1 MAG: threonine--tRNA ligase [Desulfurella sp.]HEX13588.1 threonine--tRNA ligase [Desulfurella acetivorans]